MGSLLILPENKDTYGKVHKCNLSKCISIQYVPGNDEVDVLFSLLTR